MGVATAAFYEDLKMQKYGTTNPYGNEPQAPQQPEVPQQVPVQQTANDIDDLLGQIQLTADTTDTEQAADTLHTEFRFDDANS